MRFCLIETKIILFQREISIYVPTIIIIIIINIYIMTYYDVVIIELLSDNNISNMTIICIFIMEELDGGGDEIEKKN